MATNNIPKNKDTAMEEADKWLEYVGLIKTRDSHRREAEAADKVRRQEWRKYYIADKRIRELDDILGINDFDDLVIPSDDEQKTPRNCPGAPRKRSKQV
jgi:hypothetical protein